MAFIKLVVAIGSVASPHSELFTPDLAKKQEEEKFVLIVQEIQVIQLIVSSF